MNFDKLGPIEQRNITKEYIGTRVKFMKEKYQHLAEVAVRFTELMKIVKLNESSLNIDSLTAQKVDTKVAGIIYSEIAII